MGVSSPDPRYFKDGSGLRPRWRFFFRWPKQYLWMRSPRWFKDARFAVQRWRRRNEPRPRASLRSLEGALPESPKDSGGAVSREGET